MDQIIAAVRRLVEAHEGKVVAINDESVSIDVGGGISNIYLDNLRRRVSAGEALDDVVEHFIGVLLAKHALPEDSAARNAGLRLMLEKRETVASFEAIHRQVSEEVALALAWTDPQEERVLFLTPELLSSWLLSEQEAWVEAGRQMDVLLSQVPVEVQSVAGSHLAMLVTDSVFKASLIAAPSLRQWIEPHLGWPILAVIPSRDFAYLLPLEAQNLVGRLGGVVIREFNESPYPLSPEVFSIAEQGIRAIGRFRD